MQKQYMTIKDHPHMGLNDTLCENPVAICISKKVMLSEQDIENKKCRRKLDKRMLGYEGCNWLLENKKGEKE